MMTPSEMSAMPPSAPMRRPIYRQATDLAVAVDSQLLDRAPPSERARFMGHGLLVLVVTALNFGAGTFALWLILQPSSAHSPVMMAWNGAACVLVGGIWSLVILNLFRFGLSIAHESIAPPILDRAWVKQLVWRALGVCAFAGLIGCCVALPVTIWVVRADITGHLTEGQRGALATLHAQIEARFEPELSRLYLEQVDDALEEERLRDRIRSIRAASEPTDPGKGQIEQRKTATGSLTVTAAGAADAESAVQALRDKINKRAESIREIRKQAQADKAQAAARLERQDSLFTEAHRALEYGAGLYWAIALFMTIIHAGPLLVRIFSPRGPYEHISDLVNESTLSHEGIVVNASSLRDENGVSHPVDRYLKAEAIKSEVLRAVILRRTNGLELIRMSANQKLRKVVAERSV